ncbi:amino acid permease/ SLC12A domain-containing protein [Fusarium solani]|uniref:Amino acid permease/ SLC12A domain-containing protein n=1 Tax=Fusarium solani TaxID=169388 RepID=A0A9P9L4N6_FUSSL|nr:amino acid permease/ SLC12A domain-containing protein [Fusarium solani]KAH7273912.1 amino acid permease/ SLC12A domain-containing protein [Fusarium solani]
MMALAGAIVTGLFLGPGRAVAQAGPIRAFLGYTLIGFSAAGVVLAVVEMAVLVPLSGGIVRYAEVFVDPALSFANGWNLVYKGLIFIPTEIVAAAWITIFGLLMALTNCLFVRVFGELEFGFALLKIALVFVANIMAVVIIAGGGPNGDAPGFRYWKDPGTLVQYMGIQGSLGRFLGFFLGFYTTFTNALYAFSGIEGISLAAAETANARRVIPQAAKRVLWRILIFYSLTMFLVGLVVPSNDDRLPKSKGTTASLFDISASLAGIKVIPHLINAIAVTSTYLAKSRPAPRAFTLLNRFEIPYVTVILFTLFMALGYLTISQGASTVFTWLQDLLSIAILVNWTVILITYLRLFILILITSEWQNFVHSHWTTKSFVSSYFNIPFILISYFAFKYYNKTKIIPLDEIPIRAFLDIAIADPSPPLKPNKGIRKLNFLW